MSDYNKKICVVGGGNWGRNHIRTLYELGCLSAVVDFSEIIRSEVIESYKDISVYENLEDSFNKDYDAYIVATPASTHFQIARAIIKKGYHVLIEKPMTLNSEDAEELIHLAEKNNVHIMVGHLLLFHPAIQKMKELISSGKLGKLQYIYSNRLNLGKVRTEENVFWSFAPHDISILQYFTDSYPEGIQTTGGAFLQNGVYDTTITTLSYPNNIKAHIYLSWLHPFKEHRIVVIGSEGMLSFEDSEEKKPLKFYNKKYTIKDSIPEKHEGDIDLIKYPDLAPLEEELKYFIKNIDTNKIKVSNAENGLDVIRILTTASKNLENIKANV